MAVGPVRINSAIDPRQLYGTINSGKEAQISFTGQLEKAMQKVDQLQTGRDDMVQGMVTGEVGEVHDVMIAAEEAQLSFELMLEVRNKLLEAYNEIMSLQI